MFISWGEEEEKVITLSDSPSRGVRWGSPWCLVSTSWGATQPGRRMARWNNYTRAQRRWCVNECSRGLHLGALRRRCWWSLETSWCAGCISAAPAASAQRRSLIMHGSQQQQWIVREDACSWKLRLHYGQIGCNKLKNYSAKKTHQSHSEYMDGGYNGHL